MGAQVEIEQAERAAQAGGAALRYGKLWNCRSRREELQERAGAGSPLLRLEVSGEIARGLGVDGVGLDCWRRTRQALRMGGSHRRVVGQDEAVAAVSNAVRRSRA